MVTAASEQTTPSYIESVCQSNKAGKSIYLLPPHAAKAMGGTEQEKGRLNSGGHMEALEK